MYSRSDLKRTALKKNRQYRELSSGDLFKYLGTQNQSESVYFEFERLDKEITLLIREDILDEMELV